MRYFILVISLLLYGLTNAQEKFPKDYFRPPLDIPMYLSGTFGELRTNHFHAGIDIKTQGVVGKKVYAAADGYISRIKVSLWGYGNVLYITHPNGLVTVYGHLQKFNKEITKYVRQDQYKRKSFVIELYPKKDELRVKKGDVIAFSGNTGGSAGPHLHFEIRDAGNQHPLNPLLFKSIRIKDNKKPVIAELAVYPVDQSSVINDKNDTLFLKVTGKNGVYSLKKDDQIKLHGKIAFGLRAYDRMDEINNKNGIYEEKLYIDSPLVFDIQLKELSFYTSRYINSLIDYRYLQRKKRRLIRTELDTNNQLAIYRTIKNNGIFSFNDTLTHHVEYVVKDAYGNSSRLEFDVKAYTPSNLKTDKPRPDSGNGKSIIINFAKESKIEFNGLSVTFPAKTFYRSQSVNYGKSPGTDKTFADIYTIGNRFIPMQKYASVSIDLNRTPDKLLYPKLFVAIVEKNGKLIYAGGKYESGSMNVKIRNMGRYTVAIDTVNPVIKPVNVSNNKSVTNQKTLKFNIYDNPTGSGIKKYAGFLNGKWILMEYNPKKALLTYHFDWLLKKGKNQFKLVVIDNRDNKSNYEATIINQ